MSTEELILKLDERLESIEDYHRSGYQSESSRIAWEVGKGVAVEGIRLLLEQVEAELSKDGQGKEIGNPKHQMPGNNLYQTLVDAFESFVGYHNEDENTYIEGKAKASAIHCGHIGARWQMERLQHTSPKITRDTTFILRANSEEVRKQIEMAGIHVCPCCEFKNACWLDYHTSIANGVHGVGYYDETSLSKSQAEEIQRYVSEVQNPVFCTSVEDFINKIKESITNG